MPEDGAPSSTDLLEAVQTIAWSLEEGSLATLQEAHALIYAHYMRVLEHPERSQQKVIEQRVLGALWAEFESVLDERRPEQG